LLYNYRDVSLASSALGNYATGLGINRWGEVVGSYLPNWTGEFMGRPSPNPPTQQELQMKHAFISNANGQVDLNELIPTGSGWELKEATDINDSGQIVGYGVKDGQTRAFLLTPTFMISGPPEMHGLSRVEGKFLANPGATVRVEASGNFVDWTAIKTNVANGYEVIFQDESEERHRFYRGVLLKTE
jgi:probable HAF family extracellular repeat protein